MGLEQIRDLLAQLAYAGRVDDGVGFQEVGIFGIFLEGVLEEAAGGHGFPEGGHDVDGLPKGPLAEPLVVQQRGECVAGPGGAAHPEQTDAEVEAHLGVLGLRHGDLQ